ncbi:unnamed protein product [marine sediment metagenome]|uniref:DUF4162 domain-containing protein n=1 Tax=marine sediment metagenome TaxID=412755 RepID=X0TA42_9ZZZZ
MVSMPGAAQSLPSLIGVIQETGATLRETTVREPSLETLFIKMTGKELRE